MMLNVYDRPTFKTNFNVITFFFYFFKYMCNFILFFLVLLNRRREQRNERRDQTDVSPDTNNQDTTPTYHNVADGMCSSSK